MLGEQVSRPLAARWAMIPRHGVAATVVVAEDLAEEAPDGRDGAEHPVAVLDAVLVEGVEDAASRSRSRRTGGPGRAKRARTSFRVVIGGSQMSRVEVARTQEAPQRSPVRRKVTRAGIASYLHYTWQSSARCALLQLHQGASPRVPLS